MQVLLAIFLVFFFCLILYKSSETLINSLKKIADDGLLSKFMLASIFAGLTTSLPELFVGISSAIDRRPAVAIGNAIGSNIIDLALVVPLVILLSGKVLPIHKEDFSVRNVFLIVTSSAFPFLLAFDGVISRFDGLFLVFMFFVYTFYLFPKKQKEAGIFNFLKNFSDEIHQKKTVRSVINLLLSALVMIVAAEGLVRTAVFLSQTLHVKLFFIGVFLVAAGTSIPELFISLKALREREQVIFFGDIFGSLVTNANLVVGVSTLINPIQIRLLNGYHISVIALFLVFFFFILFSYTKKVFDRREAFAMICLYLLFLIVETI